MVTAVIRTSCCLILLMPVHYFIHDKHLVDQGLKNYWGYNSIGYLAPQNDYAADKQPGGVVAEFKQMVKTLFNEPYRTNGLLDRNSDPAFVSDLEAFATPLIEPGRINSLSQTLIKLTAPGVPDIYQGPELWDLSLVDPDNRRPVDFALRRALLDEFSRLSSEAILARPKAISTIRGSSAHRRWGATDSMPSGTRTFITPCMRFLQGSRTATTRTSGL